MSRGYYVPCAPFLYLVPDSGGMDCMPHQGHRPPGPFQYLMHEQAKSLVALQELQNEVGALLEFRDLVMETFPHLRHKLATGSSSSCCTSSASSSAAATPATTATGATPTSAAVALSPAGGGPRHRVLDWEPGVRVRRKLLHKDPAPPGGHTGGDAVGSSHRKQPKSGDGSGTSSAGSSAVQDSGFCTETSSKATTIQHHQQMTVTRGALKEAVPWQFSPTHPPAGEVRLTDPGAAAAASSAAGAPDEAEDELWNLLDVIQRKGTRLRDEVAHLQRQLSLPSAAPQSPQQQQQVAVVPRTPLGALDGIVSCPGALPRVAPDVRKVVAILKEFNPVELQRHLITTVAHNQALQIRLEKTVKLHTSFMEQLEKVKDENEDLRFQLEEKSIELEGTRARMRVLERLHQKTPPTMETQTENAAVPIVEEEKQAPLLPPEETCNPILPMLALPVPGADEHGHQHHSSSTESAHDLAEHRRNNPPSSPRRRPSKIPLPGSKAYCAPRPPSGKSVTSVGASTARTKDSSLVKGMRDTSWKNKNDGTSLNGNKSRELVSTGRNSSLSARNNNKDSLNLNKAKDSLPGKSRSELTNGRKNGYGDVSHGSSRLRDSHNQNSFSSNASSVNKRDSLTGKSREASFSSANGWKGSQHQVRRVGSMNVTRAGVVDQGDRNSKVVTATDSLESKLPSDIQEVTGNGVDDQHDADSFSDSLNHFAAEEIACSPKSSEDIDFSSLTSQINLCSQVTNYENANAIASYSSSSEYFDSINDSESVLNNVTCSNNLQLQGHNLHASSCHEEMTVCDSLENKASDTFLEAVNATVNFPIKLVTSRSNGSRIESCAEY